MTRDSETRGWGVVLLLCQTSADSRIELVGLRDVDEGESGIALIPWEEVVKRASRRHLQTMIRMNNRTAIRCFFIT